jgi:hypothetical protein
MYLVHKDTIKNTGQRPGLCRRRYVLSTLHPTLRRWAISFRRHWVLPSVVGLFPSPLGSALRRWALPSAVGLCPPSLGSALRRWGLPSVVGFYPPSLGYALRRWVVPSVVGLCTLRRWVVPSVVGCTLRRWVVPSVVGLYPPSLAALRRWGSALRCWVVPSVVGLHPSSSGLVVVALAKPAWSVVVMRCFLIEAVWHCGWKGQSGGWNGRRNEENEPRHSSWFVFHDVLYGPPTPWVPPCVSPSPIPPSSELEPPTSLWKGEGRMQRGPSFEVLIWAHISHERGGAPGLVDARGLGAN